MANPLMGESVYDKIQPMGEAMTVEGTVNKSFVLIAILIASAVGTWYNIELMYPFLFPAIIVALIVAVITIFKKTLAPKLAPVYAILEGIALALISYNFELMFPGIIMQAVGLTMTIFILMLVLYKTKVIVVTEKFKSIVMAATGGIMIFYIISFIANLAGFPIPYIHEGGMVGIGFSIFVVGIASFNLLVDFDNIELGAKMELPKYMEWYNSFGLLITLVWLYLEALRLISKFKD